MIDRVKQEGMFAVVVVVGSLLGGSLDTRSQDRGIGDSATRLASERSFVPARLKSTIRASFPSYRIPENKDMVAGWSLNKTMPTPAFFCVGDFDGDGIEDAAIILIGEQTWRLVVFEQDKSGEYHPAFIARPKTKEELGKYWENEILVMPQQMILRKVPKGGTWAPEAGDDPHLGRLKVDAIELVTKPKPNADFASLLMWQKGKYQQIFSDPLVELPDGAP